ncbi:MAG: hypothetical protein IK118_04225 [Clostridia bacterium]|nr:hypothetical protein [Clostridia bacterium]
MVVSVLSDEKAADYLDAGRIREIADLTQKRIREVKAFAASGKSNTSDSTENDVERNVAAAYTSADQ